MKHNGEQICEKIAGTSPRKSVTKLNNGWTDDTYAHMFGSEYRSVLSDQWTTSDESYTSDFWL